MNSPRWITREECEALHELMVSKFGGLLGVRDEHLLESALAKPQNQHAYGSSSLMDLAASYASGIVKNPPFVDGNKRAGFMMAAGFIELNGYRFEASEADAVIHTLALAASEMTESAYAAWLETNSHPVQT